MIIGGCCAVPGASGRTPSAFACEQPQNVRPALPIRTVPFLRAFILASRADAFIQESRVGAMSSIRSSSFTEPGGGGRAFCLTDEVPASTGAWGPA